MRKRKMCMAAAIVLFAVSTCSYVQAEDTAAVKEAAPAEETPSDSPAEKAENEEPVQNTEAVYQDEKLAVYTQGYPAADREVSEINEESGRKLVLSITADGKVTAEQTLEYFTDPGNLQIQTKEPYEMETLLLDGEPLENGAAVTYGEKSERKVEIVLHTKAQMLVHYRDAEGNPLAKDSTLSGRLGEEVFWKNPVINGYECEKPEGQAVLEKASGDITVVYHKAESKEETKTGINRQDIKTGKKDKADGRQKAEENDSDSEQLLILTLPIN